MQLVETFGAHCALAQGRIGVAFQIYDYAVFDVSAAGTHQNASVAASLDHLGLNGLIGVSLTRIDKGARHGHANRGGNASKRARLNELTPCHG